MQAEDIILECRYKLSDTSKDRWSDARLISLLNKGIRDIAKNTTLFVENMFYVVPNLLVDIDMSDYVTNIVRAEYLDEVLPFYSFEEMDYKYGKLWQQDEGEEVIALVYDKQKNGLLKQYPIVTNSQNPHIEYTGTYGIVTDISYSDIQPILEDVYGDISSIPDEALIKFYYIRKHEKITAITDELLIDDLIEQPLIHYIVGTAFRDNQDEQNRALGNEELSFYYQTVKEYGAQKAHLFVDADNVVRYRPND